MRRWAGIAVLVLAVAGSGWVLREVGVDLFDAPGSSRHIPDFYMENFATVTMDGDGRPRRRLEAEYMAHFPDSDSNELQAPYIILYRDGAEPWHVTSERGWTSGNGEVLLLLGKVHIWRNTESGERKVDIETRDLRVLPESDYGETEEAVVIRTRTSETRGVGMRAWLDRSRLQLNSDVRTVIQRGGSE